MNTKSEKTRLQKLRSWWIRNEIGYTIQALFMCLIVILVIVGIIYVNFFAPCEEVIRWLPAKSLPARCLAMAMGN